MRFCLLIRRNWHDSIPFVSYQSHYDRASSQSHDVCVPQTENSNNFTIQIENFYRLKWLWHEVIAVFVLICWDAKNSAHTISIRICYLSRASAFQIETTIKKKTMSVRCTCGRHSDSLTCENFKYSKIMALFSSICQQFYSELDKLLFFVRVVSNGRVGNEMDMSVPYIVCSEYAKIDSAPHDTLSSLTNLCWKLHIFSICNSQHLNKAIVWFAFANAQAPIGFGNAKTAKKGMHRRVWFFRVFLTDCFISSLSGLSASFKWRFEIRNLLWKFAIS